MPIRLQITKTWHRIPFNFRLLLTIGHDTSETFSAIALAPTSPTHSVVKEVPTSLFLLLVFVRLGFAQDHYEQFDAIDVALRIQHRHHGTGWESATRNDLGERTDLFSRASC